MTTPAQQRGIIENVTKLKLFDNGEYSQSDLSQTWVLTQDDGSHFPFFAPVGKGDDFERVFTLANMEVMQAQALPKFPVGSRVKVVASGWGLGPDAIGQVYTVLDFTLGADHNVYKVADDSGMPITNSAWEPSFELAPPLVPRQVAITIDVPTLPPATSPYTELQQTAINVFQAMYDAAVAYRNGELTTLNADYGICDNIDRFARAHGSSETPMSEVKENLIRQTEIYSGNYTYPVPCPDGGDASNAFSRHSNKWRGAYGMNRLIQLGQLIELIKTKWDDSMVNRKTPAFRNGLKVGDVVRYTRRDTPSFWVFRRDDESMSPTFHKLTDKDDYTDLDLNHVVKVDKDEICKPRAVSEFLSELEAQAKKKADIERQITELQKALTNVQTDIAMLDYGLADQHKVKRIA